ncbi:regulatory protein TetR [Pseudodesulfovibrio mercurii]|uniref:Regulatory protein TetR n=1 Tax=Pseudodesulfovibrio mercurii TaxID=641491 RepID=F0JIM6_9BACT|nr:TetR/AcrR family transcriptional regulator [Pseudodesulfovibrio mercurii]EGB15460.1 regulatory protein TetR [Pseudodesulfovibrio mercurii]
MAKDASLREERKAETRRRIQAAARTLIAEKGFEATTMRDLAQAAGVGVGTIALHFRDKTSLLFSSFFDDIGEVSRRAIASAPRDVPLREQFRHMLRTMYGYYGEHTLFLRSVVKEALFATGEWKARFDGQLREIVGEVAGLIEARKATGEVRSDVSGLQLAMVCWSLYAGGLIDGLNRERFDVEGQVASVMGLLDVVLAGVLADVTGGGHGPA